MSMSKSMQLPQRPDIAAFLQDAAFDVAGGYDDDDSEVSSDEDDSGSRPCEEVWPEEGLARECWSEYGGLRRSATFQPVSNIFSLNPPTPPETAHHLQIQHSRSAHSRLNELVKHDRSVEDSEENLIGSAHSELDEMEKKALATRQAWMERGSIACLGTTPENEEVSFQRHPHHPEVYGCVHSNGIQSQYGSYSCLLNEEFAASSNQMRRSCTADEFRRPRRRLPRRPDDMSAPVNFPQSKSMYERMLREGMSNLNNYLPRVPDCPSVDHRSVEEDEQNVRTDRPPSLQLKNKNEQKMDSYSMIETPISPHVLPSPGSSGRRLPALPVPYLRNIPRMAAPKPTEQHQLCFMDGMTDSIMDRSSMGESYYEEDGLNGNNRRKNKGFFSAEDSSGVSSCTTSDSQNPTHRVQSAFHPRHPDEVLLEIGDAIHVDRSGDDHWSYGTNLRTGQSGIFPTAVVCEIDIVEEICMGALPSNMNQKMTNDRDTFYLTMLASIEVAHHKGNDILVQAMNKVLALYKDSEEVIVPQTVLMEISFRGIHVIDKKRKNFFQCPTFDFFYSLQNISFCGAHPKQLKYFGFITKHPLLPRFACHVFMCNTTTQPIVESIGRAFKRSYDEYMAFAHPTEDIYLE